MRWTVDEAHPLDMLSEASGRIESAPASYDAGRSRTARRHERPWAAMSIHERLAVCAPCSNVTVLGRCIVAASGLTAVAPCPSLICDKSK